jgi:uncharacterized protein YneF (UPF0154 family)
MKNITLVIGISIFVGLVAGIIGGVFITPLLQQSEFFQPFEQVVKQTF